MPTPDAPTDLVCKLTLRVGVGPRSVVPVTFRVDTGSSWSLMALATAQRLGLPVPDESHDRKFTLAHAGGVQAITVRDGLLRAWWDVGRVGTPFEWPVRFVVDAPAGFEPLLGLGGVVRDCQWVFDGRPADDAPFGTATFHDVRS